MDCLLTQGEGANLSPSVAGGTSHSVSMVISRCHSPWRRTESFLISVRKKGSLHCIPIPLFFSSSFFPVRGSNSSPSDRRRGLDLRPGWSFNPTCWCSWFCSPPLSSCMKERPAKEMSKVWLSRRLKAKKIEQGVPALHTSVKLVLCCLIWSEWMRQITF